jgi:hypothetical protein
MTDLADSAITKLNRFLRHLNARDIPVDELLVLKAEAFEACAARSCQLGDHGLAEAEEKYAADAWLAVRAARARAST